MTRTLAASPAAAAAAAAVTQQIPSTPPPYLPSSSGVAGSARSCNASSDPAPTSAVLDARNLSTAQRRDMIRDSGDFSACLYVDHTEENLKLSNKGGGLA